MAASQDTTSLVDVDPTLQGGVYQIRNTIDKKYTLEVQFDFICDGITIGMISTRTLIAIDIYKEHGISIAQKCLCLKF